jgi:hypothetical protein
LTWGLRQSETGIDHEMFAHVLKKFFTFRPAHENNPATGMEIAMKDAVKTLLAGNARGAVEDAAGMLALFALVFAVLSLPGSI